ncbi:hypothetical protein KI387_035066, partial [Taxus chinensis]
VLKAKLGSEADEGVVLEWQKVAKAVRDTCNRENWMAFQANLAKGKKLMMENRQNELWNWLKAFMGRGDKGKCNAQPMRNVDGDLITNPSEVLESWKTHYMKLLCDPSAKDRQHWEGIPLVEHPPLTSINGPIGWKEFHVVVKSLEYHKAAGEDGLPPEWFKAVLGQKKRGRSGRWQKFKADKSPMVKACLKVMNCIWEHGVIPKDFNVVVLVSIPKKGDLTLHDNYRGISLINVMLKILTSVVIKRIEKELEERKFFSKIQAGFRRNEECVGQVAVLHEIALRRMAKLKKPMFVVFIDFKKAYDMVPHEALFRKLHAAGVKGKALHFIQELYNGSSVRVRHDGLLSSHIPVKRGVRQGCPASPTLFNIFINDIMQDLEGMGVKVPGLTEVVAGLLFADDLVALAESVEEMHVVLQRIQCWSDKWGMECGIDKCKVMKIFGDGEELQQHVFKLGEHEIGFYSSYKYLGIETDP